MKVSNAVTAPQPTKRKNLDSTASHAEHIKVVADRDSLHRDPRHLSKDEKRAMSRMARAYENLIANLAPDKFAAMEATFADRNDGDKSTLEITAALSLIAPKELQKFMKDGVFKILPSTVQNAASKVALTLFRAFAKISGVKVAQPKAEHYAKRPSDAVIRETVRKDFQIAPKIAA